jgi:hypothetical protein
MNMASYSEAFQIGFETWVGLEAKRRGISEPEIESMIEGYKQIVTRGPNIDGCGQLRAINKFNTIAEGYDILTNIEDINGRPYYIIRAFAIKLSKADNENP